MVDEVHHAAGRIAAALPEVVVQRLCEQHGGCDVGAPVALHRGMAEGGGCVVFEQRGVVHQCVEPPHPRDDRRHQRAAGGFVGEVGRKGVGACAGGAQRLGGGFGLGLRAPVMQRDVVAAGREAERDLAAQSAGGAGDQHDGAGSHGS